MIPHRTLIVNFTCPKKYLLLSISIKCETIGISKGVFIMNKIRNFISRFNKQALVGGLCLALGICFIALSGAFLSVTVRVAGAILGLISAVRFIFAIKQYRGGFLTAAVVNSALLFLVGLVVALNPGGTLNLIYATIGAYLVINALTHLYRLATAKKMVKNLSWWVEMLSSAVILVLGFWLIFLPGVAQRLTEILAGVALIIKSAELFEKAYNEEKQRKKQKSNDIEADFVDKSHEL